MTKLTVSDLIKWIGNLEKNKDYHYYSGRSVLQIDDVSFPEGPVSIRRKDTFNTTESYGTASISQSQLATVASIFTKKPNYPIHFDRLFSAGGNSRSALETLLALTPHFFICYPQRTNLYNGRLEKKLKHIMWCPDDAHNLGVIAEKDYDRVLTEVEYELDFGEVQVGQVESDSDIDSLRTHTQMQVALVKIGEAMNFYTWIAANDRQLKVGGANLGDFPRVVKSLDEVSILYSVESKKAAKLIDCIWFSSDFKHIPAVIEIEHSTGVTSGITRMMKLKETIPSIKTSYTVVAPNDLRSKVVQEATSQAFRSMAIRYMSYTSLRELYGLMQRYDLSQYVSRPFIEPFMETLVENMDV